MKDEEGFIPHPSAFILFKGLDPSAAMRSVISAATRANSPAIADDMLNILTRSGSSPICWIRCFTYSIRRLALALPSR